MRAGRPSARTACTDCRRRASSFAWASPGLGGAGGLVETLLDAGQVGETKLDADDLPVANGVDTAGHVLDVGVVETANHVDDRVHLANVGEELISQPFSLARSLHQSGDIQELDRRGDRLLRLHDVREGIQARIGDGDDPGVRFNGRERIVRHQGTRTGQGIEEGGFADVG